MAGISVVSLARDASAALRSKDLGMQDIGSEEQW